MTLTNRRIVTALDADGRSAILFDDAMADLPVADRQISVVWHGETVPADNSGTRETCDVPMTMELFSGQGTVFVLVDLKPGESPYPNAMHTTDTLDYIIVLRGKIRMTLDTGEVVLQPGDVCVNRGVNRNWTATEDGPAVMAAVLTPAVPNARPAD